MNLADKLRAKYRPVALEDRFKIVVLPPVIGHAMVDHAGLLVENLLRISIVTNGAIDSLPDVKLLAAPPVITERKFVLVVFLRRDQRVTEVVAHGGLRNALVRPLDKERILVIVKIDRHVSVKIDRIGAGCES